RCTCTATTSSRSSPPASRPPWRSRPRSPDASPSRCTGRARCRTVPSCISRSIRSSVTPTTRTARRAHRAARALDWLAPFAPAAARAHGFGQRFDLPLPLWLWLTGAGATIVITFVLVAVFVREERPLARYPRLDLLRFAPVRALANGATASVLRAIAALLFIVTIAAGLFGNPDPYSNLIPTMVWVVWWVGVAFCCALIGDLWSVINPWESLFTWSE